MHFTMSENALAHKGEQAGISLDGIQSLLANGSELVEFYTQGFFLVSSGAEIRPLSQWDLGDFFPNLKKKIPISKKKKNFFFFFFF